MDLVKTSSDLLQYLFSLGFAYGPKFFNNPADGKQPFCAPAMIYNGFAVVGRDGYHALYSPTDRLLNAEMHSPAQTAAMVSILFASNEQN